MLKKTGIVLLLSLACFGAAYAQLPKGMEVNIDAETNALQLNRTEKSDADLRKEAGRDVGQIVALPFGSHNWYGGTNLSFSYNGGFFGGAFGLGVVTAEKQYYDEDKREWFDLYPVRAGAMNVWLKLFGDRLKLSLGNGVGSGYADGQGGEGLRIYNGVDQDSWDKNRHADDVVQDEGLLLEGFLGPVSLALAGRYYTSALFNKSLNPSGSLATQNTKYASMEQYNFSYGARVGSKIGEIAKASASWIVEYDNKTGENYTEDRNGVLVPRTGEAEFTRHLFGVFASLYPLDKLGVSLSYNSIFTQYPAQVYGAQQMINITLPQLYQQAVNLALRYDGIQRLTLRTDHNISFWEDKNFRIYNFPGLEDAGITAETDITLAAPMVGHLLVWNGLGAGYEFSDVWKAELYVRNLHRRDTAADTEKGMEYRFTRNQIKGELKMAWRPSENLEFYFGLEIENTVTLLSEDVAKDTVGIRDGFTVLENAREIRDTVLALKIPVGMTLRIR